MKTTKPHELLRAYAQDHSESAFQELVNRYVDLVYSAAIRRVSGDRQLAEDVTQEVFADLARKAAALPPNVMLGGWLLRHTGYVASTAMRGEQRRRDRERQAVEMNALNEPSGAGWSQFAPVLDEAMDELDVADRDALVLRYFERCELRAVGEALGVSDDTAQKRVSRALEKLHVLLKQRGATLSAAALGTALATQAVTAAPAGLSATITAAALSGTAITTTALTAATKAIAMTTLQKTLITAALAVAVGTGIYEARQAANARAEVQTLQQQQAPLAEQIQQLKQERDETARQLASSREESERLNRNTGELLKLRAEVTRLRNSAQTSKTQGVDQPMDTSNPLWKPNWIVFRPFDLTRFPDSQVPISGKKAKDVGISSPAALLQTWIWAQRTGDTAGLLKTWDFPDGTTEEQKMEHILSAQKGAQDYQEHPDTRAETCKLHDLFDIGNGYYLAFIEQERLTTGTWIGHQYFRHMGDEWKVSFGRQTK